MPLSRSVNYSEKPGSDKIRKKRMTQPYKNLYCKWPAAAALFGVEDKWGLVTQELSHETEG